MTTIPIIKSSNSPKQKMLALTAAGCFRQWEPAKTNDGHYNDSHYLNWIQSEAIIQEWNFQPEDCDRAWKEFRARHRDRYPNGNWQVVEEIYINSIK